MTGRIEEICAALKPCRVFADVGCDHGYMSEYMLKNDLCERAYISDISAGSLKKAERLLHKYVLSGRCIAVVANGLEGIQEACDEVLIAGMGGMEIVEILQKYPLPERFVLQPMKNSKRVRAFLAERGAGIERDYTFGEGKFYDLITGTAAGGSKYSGRELLYGRDNLKRPTPAFLGLLKHDANNLIAALSVPGFSGERREAVREKLSELEELIHETERRLQDS